MNDIERARVEVARAVATLTTTRNRLRRTVARLHRADKTAQPVHDALGERYTAEGWAAGSIGYVVDEALSTTIRELRQETREDYAAQVAAEVNRCREIAARRRAVQLAAELRPDLADLEGIRDRALLMLAFSSTLTPAELAALSSGDVFVNEEARRVHVFTERHGRRERLPVPYDDHPARSLPVALLAWAAAAKLRRPCPIFPALSHGKPHKRMAPRAIAALVGRHLAAARCLVDGHNAEPTAAPPDGRAVLSPAELLAAVREAWTAETIHDAVLSAVRSTVAAAVADALDPEPRPHAVPALPLGPPCSVSEQEARP